MVNNDYGREFEQEEKFYREIVGCLGCGAGIGFVALVFGAALFFSSPTGRTLEEMSKKYLKSMKSQIVWDILAAYYAGTGPMRKEIDIRQKPQEADVPLRELSIQELIGNGELSGYVPKRIGNGDMRGHYRPPLYDRRFGV